MHNSRDQCLLWTLNVSFNDIFVSTGVDYCSVVL